MYIAKEYLELPQGTFKTGDVVPNDIYDMLSEELQDKLKLVGDEDTELLTDISIDVYTETTKD